MCLSCHPSVSYSCCSSLHLQSTANWGVGSDTRARGIRPGFLLLLNPLETTQPFCACSSFLIVQKDTERTKKSGAATSMWKTSLLKRPRRPNVRGCQQKSGKIICPVLWFMKLFVSFCNPILWAGQKIPRGRRQNNNMGIYGQYWSTLHNRSFPAHLLDMESTPLSLSVQDPAFSPNLLESPRALFTWDVELLRSANRSNIAFKSRRLRTAQDLSHIAVQNWIPFTVWSSLKSEPCVHFQ